jgi:hypothetical protein
MGPFATATMHERVVSMSSERRRRGETAWVCVFERAKKMERWDMGFERAGAFARERL